MLKLPTGAEIKGLFVAPTRVAHAIKGMGLAVTSLDGVSRHNEGKAKANRSKSAVLSMRAEIADDRADDHTAEAVRARRVASNLRGLLA
jgi:hypothetical protein